jgi:hypothetical protein
MVRKNGPEMNGCYHGLIFLMFRNKDQFSNLAAKLLLRDDKPCRMIMNIQFFVQKGKFYSLNPGRN